MSVTVVKYSIRTGSGGKGRGGRGRDADERGKVSYR